MHFRTQYTYKYLAEYENEVPEAIPNGITYRHPFRYRGSRPKNKYHSYDPVRYTMQQIVLSKLKRPQNVKSLFSRKGKKNKKHRRWIEKKTYKMTVMILLHLDVENGSTNGPNLTITKGKHMKNNTNGFENNSFSIVNYIRSCFRKRFVQENENRKTCDISMILTT